MIIPDHLPARYCGRGPLCFLLFVSLSLAGAASYFYLLAHPTSGFNSPSPSALAVEHGRPRELWSPRYRNNSLLCLEPREHGLVASWYLGRGGAICAEKVEVSGCERELLEGCVTGRRQIELGESCCSALSVVCRAFYAYAHRCEERLVMRD